MTRIGILGGSFNPPHVGHLICAQEALWQLGLDRVVLVPVGVPPHKRLNADPGTEHRLELCRLAVGRDERLAVSAIEIERGGASYTVDTLTALGESDPHDELTFIAGGDTAASLPGWREPERVLELARFAVAAREDVDRERVESAVSDLAGGDSLVFFDMPRVDVSSSMVRARVAEGRPIRYLVADEVAAHIGANGLYRSPVVSA